MSNKWEWCVSSDGRLATWADDGAADPLLGFAFLQTFIDIFQEYFGGISLAIVKDNFDVVYQVWSMASLPMRNSLTTR